MKNLVLFSLLLFSLCCAWPAEAKKAKTSSNIATHKVAKGDTLYGIARKNGLTVDTLKRLNGLKGTKIKPGMVLQLRAKSETAHTAAAKQQKPAPDVAPPAGEMVCDLPPTDSPLPLPAGDLEEVALAYLATPYRFGAENRNSTDCSGFTQQVFRQLGLELPRTAREQFLRGANVPAGEWQRGDLLFFRTYARYPSHVGIYLQDGKMIHASRTKRQVVISKIDLPYFRKRYLGARRVADFDPVANLIEGLMNKVNEVNEEEFLDGDLEELELPAQQDPGPLAALPQEAVAPTPPAGG